MSWIQEWAPVLTVELTIRLSVPIWNFAFTYRPYLRGLINVTKLNNPATAKLLKETIRLNLFRSCSENQTPKQHWKHLRDILYSSAKITIGLQKRIHRDWFDKNNSSIMHRKHTAFKAVLGSNTQENRARYQLARNTCQGEPKPVMAGSCKRNWAVCRTARSKILLSICQVCVSASPKWHQPHQWWPKKPAVGKRGYFGSLETAL